MGTCSYSKNINKSHQVSEKINRSNQVVHDKKISLAKNRDPKGCRELREASRDAEQNPSQSIWPKISNTNIVGVGTMNGINIDNAISNLDPNDPRRQHIAKTICNGVSVSSNEIRICINGIVFTTDELWNLDNVGLSKEDIHAKRLLYEQRVAKEKLQRKLEKEKREKERKEKEILNKTTITHSNDNVQPSAALSLIGVQGTVLKGDNISVSASAFGVKVVRNGDIVVSGKSIQATVQYPELKENDFNIIGNGMDLNQMIAGMPDFHRNKLIDSWQKGTCGVSIVGYPQSVRLGNYTFYPSNEIYCGSEKIFG